MWNVTPSGSGSCGGMWLRVVARWPAAWSCRATWLPMTPDDSLARRSNRKPGRRYDADGPSHGPDWDLRFTVTFRFPNWQSNYWVLPATAT